MQPNASAKASRPILAERQDIDKHSWRLRHLSHSHPWCYKCLVGVREGVRMRRLALFFGLGALLAAPPGAADAASDLSLTVYNSDLALVQDVRRLDAPAGRTRLEFRDVSASIRPETVTLSGDGLAIVEQNFDYDLLTPAKMMEKAVGKQIKIVRTMPGTGRETTESATVLSVNDGVILKIGNRIEVLRDDGIPTRVIFDSIPANLRASPTLSVTVDASSTGPRDVTLSYLTTGLSWKADYVALFDEEKGALRLQGWITLTNNSGTTFDNARTQLVAGDINLTGTQAQNWQRQQAQSTFNGGTNSAGQGSVADYLLYSLPERVTIAENQTKQVGFIELHDVKSSKSYDVWAPIPFMPRRFSSFRTTRRRYPPEPFGCTCTTTRASRNSSARTGWTTRHQVRSFPSRSVRRSTSLPSQLSFQAKRSTTRIRVTQCRICSAMRNPSRLP